MDINMTCVQDPVKKSQKEKQCTEGWCFSCNKQEHIKRNCPLNGKEGSSLGPNQPTPTAQVTQAERQSSEEATSAMSPPLTLQETKDWMFRLHRMSIEEKDEVIDALMG